MKPTEIAAQFIGIAAMAFNIFSYQRKSQKSVITFQLFSAAFFATNYFLLGAVIGGILNIIGIVRAVVFLFKEKLKADHIAYWLYHTLFYSIHIKLYITW